MKPLTRKTAGGVICLALAASLHAATLLENPGFELDHGGGTTSLPGWQSFGPNTYGETNTLLAHSGTNYLKVYQAFTGVANQAGVYQDYISGPGTIYVADGWAYTAASDALAGQNTAWIEVTFRDATANVLALYRTALISTNALAAGAFPKSRWTDLAITNQCDPATGQVTNTTTQIVAPSGTRFLRYRVLFQGDANNSAGSVYFDDLNLTQTGGAPYGNLNIVWSDEFNGAAIDPLVWTYDTGNGGWGNSELEYYTSRTNNAYVAGGLLHLVARAESYGGSSYTSARMKSEGLFSWKYGRVEWRAQLPAGTGFWPALWMLGTNITTVDWPGCGEVDVMENNGGNPYMAQGSLHSGSDATAIYTFIGGAAATNFNTYTLDWTTNALLFYVDGRLYETQTNWSSSTGNAYPFPFDQPFFLIMNLAIGGSYLGKPTTNAINAGTTFPGEVSVDYVRIYQPTAPLQLTVKPNGSNLLLTWPTNIVCHLESQTNPLAGGLGGGWTAVGANTSPLTLKPASASVFYRLASP
jgi:beta-glucanase (GH16 family)